MKRADRHWLSRTATLVCAAGVLSAAPNSNGGQRRDLLPPKRAGHQVVNQKGATPEKIPADVQRQQLYDALRLRALGPSSLSDSSPHQIHGGQTIVAPTAAAAGPANGVEVLGACCNFGTGECLDDLTNCDCVATGGSWAPGLCSDFFGCSSSGACCNDFTGECTEGLTLNDCFNSGGSSWTPDATCDDIACPPTGACCDLATSTCTDDVPVFDCYNAGGLAYIDVACADISCPPTGACCTSMGCTDDFPIFDCYAAGGVAYEGLTCADIVCPPSGACCDTTTATCTDDVSIFDCFDAGGFAFVDVTCAEFDCPLIQTGACCEPAIGACSDGVAQFDCFFPGSVWTAGVACSDITCPPVGACCNPTTGTCTDTEQPGCPPSGLWYQSASCAEIACPGAECGFLNPSFETGNFSGWIPQDLAVPFFPLTVQGSGIEPGFGFFLSAPTDGSFAALTGWDGEGPGTIVLAQDISIPAGATTLEFDYRAAWDLETYCAQQDRTFAVSIQPPGGGPPLSPPQVMLTAPAGTMQFDTGNLTAAVDVSAHAGSSVRISFEWYVPEVFSGPAFFQLDNLRCTVSGGCACIDGKVTICHHPPGNPANAKTLSVGCAALPAHLNHGDSCGPCD